MAVRISVSPIVSTDVDRFGVLLLLCSSIYDFFLMTTREFEGRSRDAAREARIRRGAQVSKTHAPHRPQGSMTFGLSVVKEECKKKGLSLIRWSLSATRKDDLMGWKLPRSIYHPCGVNMLSSDYFNARAIALFHGFDNMLQTSKSAISRDHPSKNPTLRHHKCARRAGGSPCQSKIYTINRIDPRKVYFRRSRRIPDEQGVGQINSRTEYAKTRRKESTHQEERMDLLFSVEMFGSLLA